MAMKRIDMYFSKDGNLHVSAHLSDNVKIQETKKNCFYIEVSSWQITINWQNTYIFCASKAKEKRRKFSIRTRSGSLFLYNSTTNWYWNFRNRSLQKMLDALHVDRIVNMDNNTADIEVVLAKEDGVYKEYQGEDFHTIRFISDTMEKPSIKEYAEVENGMRLAMATFTFGKYLMVETTKGHHLLYLYNVRVHEVFKEIQTATLGHII